nr:zinc finger, CCHC-type [Tanacetum cinerariifolium]
MMISCSNNIKMESLYGVWTRFKNFIQRVPRHGLDLWTQIQIFYNNVNYYNKMDLNFATDGDLRELSAEEAWETIENFAQGQKTVKDELSPVFEFGIKPTPRVAFGVMRNLTASPPIVTTFNVVTRTVEKTNDGFQTMGKKKKRKGKSKSTNSG